METYYEVSANWWAEQLWDNIEELSHSFKYYELTKSMLSMFEKHLEKVIKEGIVKHGVLLISTFSVSNILENATCIFRLDYKLIPKDVEMRITPDIITIFNGFCTKTLYSRAEGTV